jgi:hypothetical protein
MSDTTLRDLVLKRLEADTKPEDEWSALVPAALELAEGLELLLTGDTYRWRDRSKIWRDGWRNLHHPKAALAADFALEGERGTCEMRFASGRTDNGAES